jgi:hypothetical protein
MTGTNKESTKGKKERDGGIVCYSEKGPEFKQVTVEQAFPLLVKKCH